MVSRELGDRTREILDSAVADLRDAGLSRPTLGLAQTALKILKRRRDYDDVITDLERLRSDIAKIGQVLARCGDSLRQAESAEADRLPDGAVWWNRRIRTVVTAFAELDSATAQARWMAVWVDGLEREAWSRCKELVGLDAVPASAAELGTDMRAVTDAMQTGQYAHALDPLDRLFDEAGGDGSVPARLGLLRTRILLREFSDRDIVRDAAGRTVEKAAGSGWESLALAGLAQAQLAADEVDAARTTLQRAMRSDGSRTDPLIMAGLLAERDGLWTLADQYYDRAVAGDPMATSAVLLRPVPARLLVRAASSSSGEQAVDLLRHALDLGVRGEGDYPEKDVQLALAEKLVERALEQERHGSADGARDSRVQAAAAFVEAGRGYAGSRLTARSVELFDKACKMAPDNAEYRWTYAEALRLDSYRLDGTSDHDMLVQAQDQLEQGIQLRQPAVDEAWVLVTQAIIQDELQPPTFDDGPAAASTDPCLLIERALVKDPDYARGYSFLASALRRRGYIQEAREAAEHGRERLAAPDAFYVETYVNLLMDLRDYDAALRMITDQLLRQPDDDLRLLQAVLLLRRAQPRQALESLADLEPTDSVRLVRAHSLFAAGDVDSAREEFSSLWFDTRSGPGTGIAGWAAFRAGYVEEGIELYLTLPPTTAELPYSRDLGQMYLVKGELEHARPLLEKGIAGCPFPDDLINLRSIEFDFIRWAVASLPHADAVESMLAQLTERIDARCAALCQARREVGPVSVLAADARRAMHADSPLEALNIYEQLLAFMPEADLGAFRAGRAARDAADALFVAGQHDNARHAWATVQAALARISPTADSELLGSLACRGFLADLVEGKQDHASAWLDEIGLDYRSMRTAMSEATRTLAFDAPHLWSLRDGLLAVRQKAGTAPAHQQWLADLAAGLPIARVYGLAAANAATLNSTFLYVPPLEARLGANLADLVGSSELDEATKDLQRRIETETGVRIPWVYAGQADRMDRDQVDFRVYGRWVSTIHLTGEPATWLGTLIDALEQIVHGHLFRLVGVDDVQLWLEGWNLSHRDAPVWDQADPLADRLRLARLLRMLLREGVSVRDREAIVAVLRSSGRSDRGRLTATLDTLREVRLRLGRQALGAEPGTPVIALPAELETRVKSGLQDDRPILQLPREESHRLVEDLRRWLGTLPALPPAVSVEDPRVRPFVWRLLAAQKPPVRVLSEEELA